MEQTSNLISVIVPVYNVEKYLSRCLDSIINQTYKNLEIILIDDGSPDNSGKICDEYAKKDIRIKVIHKENGGVSSARNVGLENVTGDYITFVDSDDWIEPNMYEEMLKVAKGENVDLVRCSYCKEYKDETIGSQSIYKFDEKIDMNKDRYRVLKNLISGKMHGYLWLLLIKKDKIKQTHLFNTVIAMREDFLWVIELLFHIDSIYIYNKKFYHYFQNTNSVTNSIAVKQRNMENMLIVSECLKTILEKYKIYSSEIKEIYGAYFVSRVSSDLAIILFNTRNHNTLEYVMNNNVFVEIINNTKYKGLSIFNKIFLWLYRRKMKKILYRYCIFREYVRGKILRGE